MGMGKRVFYAKTGSHNGYTGLSGYLPTRNGVRLGRKNRLMGGRALRPAARPSSQDSELLAGLGRVITSKKGLAVASRAANRSMSLLVAIRRGTWKNM